MANEQQDNQVQPGKGKAFFDRADQVAETGNWDFAIQMYLEGIRREPGNLERGHKPLRNVSLRRKAEGGKPAGLVEQFKRKANKDPLESLVNAEYMLAKDPGNVAHMFALLRALEKLQQHQAMQWICDILFESERQAKKANKRHLIAIAEAYGSAGDFRKALAAADMGRQIDPEDEDLQEMQKDLSAKTAIQQGQYDGKGSFTTSVKDMRRQMDLSQADQLYQSPARIEESIAKARAEYEASPEVAGKIDALVQALLQVEEEGCENEAIDVLKKAYADTKAYRFKSRIDDILIRQVRRRLALLKAQNKTEEARQLEGQVLTMELGIFAERALNYPTDLAIKYELGIRQLDTGHIDEAIASLQQARRDPKRRITSLMYLGRAFERKGWHKEAVESYQQALEAEPSDERAKAIQYNLGLIFRTMGQKQQALDHFSIVAQMDYTYRDVRQQIEELRREISGSPGTEDREGDKDKGKDEGKNP
jgi:tetratricopeptide (TPR) repeat protein